MKSTTHFTGHHASIQSLRTPNLDSPLLLTASLDGTSRLFDTRISFRCGAQHCFLVDQGQEASCSSWFQSLDGHEHDPRIAVCDDLGQVLVFDLRTSCCVQRATQAKQRRRRTRMIKENEMNQVDVVDVDAFVIGHHSHVVVGTDEAGILPWSFEEEKQQEERTRQVVLEGDGMISTCTRVWKPSGMEQVIVVIGGMDVMKEKGNGLVFRDFVKGTKVMKSLTFQNKLGSRRKLNVNLPHTYGVDVWKDSLAVAVGDGSVVVATWKNGKKVVIEEIRKDEVHNEPTCAVAWCASNVLVSGTSSGSLSCLELTRDGELNVTDRFVHRASSKDKINALASVSGGFVVADTSNIVTMYHL